VSDIGTSSNGAFDLPFLVLQGLGALFFFFALFALRPQLPGLRAGQALHAALCVALPALWLLAWPVTSGIEGAGRFLIGGPATLITGLLGLGWVALAARRVQQSPWPSAGAVALGVAVWGVFVVT
jgi:hypothetical protein